MVSHTFNFFLQDVQIPGALGIARPAQPPSRAPIGGPPPPRAIQGLHALACSGRGWEPDGGTGRRLRRSYDAKGTGDLHILQKEIDCMRNHGEKQLLKVVLALRSKAATIGRVGWSI